MSSDVIHRAPAAVFTSPHGCAASTKKLTHHPSRRLVSLVEPPLQTRISRISHTSLFERSEVANTSWLLTSFKILPHSLLVLQVNTLGSGSTDVWRRRLPRFVGVTAAVRGGLLPADGALKKIWPVGLGGGRDH